MVNYDIGGNIRHYIRYDIGNITHDMGYDISIQHARATCFAVRLRSRVAAPCALDS